MLATLKIKMPYMYLHFSNQIEFSAVYKDIIHRFHLLNNNVTNKHI